MIVIQQAIYGEVPGKTSGHDLLGSSSDKNELFRRVSGHTDLADRPEGGDLSGPVVRGFFIEDHFLLIKTFPDKSPGLRSGRVFAHALFIPKADVHRLHNLSDLFQYHLPGIQKEAVMYPLEYNSQEALTTTGVVDGRAAAATNALLQNEPFVWLGEAGYWEWMARIWPQLPIEVRQILKIGPAFGPTYSKNEYLNLHYIPEEAKTLWERHSFRIIDSGETESLQSAAAHWLLRNTKEAEPFQVLIDDFVPKIESIEHLNQLQDYGKAYHQIDNHPELNRLLLLANFISQTSPNERIGVKGKNRLMSAIIKAIQNAPLKMFKALNYQSWKGFPDAMTSPSDAARDWLINYLLQGEHAKEGGGVLVRAMETGPKNWWAKTVLEYVTDRLKKRQPSDATVLWHWMIREPSLITKHASWLPNDAEDELAKKIPKLDTAVAESVLHMAEQKNWLVLYAKVAAECYSAKKAIEALLRIDKDENHTIALEVLSESIKDNSFVPIAASLTDPRLYRIAGKLIAGNSLLLKGIDIASEGWQCCWEAATQQGGEVWSGIFDPQKTLFEILDHLLAGNSFSETLLNAMSTGKYNSLKDYHKRASIWHHLPAKARSGFITATLEGLIDELATGQLHYKDLETELKSGMQSEEILQQVIGSKNILFNQKILLFDVLPGLGARHAQQLMHAHPFSTKEAKSFGRLVSKKQWKVVADALYNQHIHKKDLVPALLQCSHLLGFLERLKLLVSGLKQDAISEEEWWNEFLEISFKLFPSGPEQDGLWLSAGGDMSGLYLSGTGREKWSHAVRILRYNGSPTTKKLVKKMREIYPGNEILKNLQDIL